MDVRELNRDQLTQLKASYYDELHPEGVSYGELASINDLVTDAEILEAYAGVCFVDDDFAI